MPDDPTICIIVTTCYSPFHFQEILFGRDSPLSVTGNVIGILIFVSTRMIYIQVHVNSVRNADRRSFEMANTLRGRIDEVEHFKSRLQEKSSGIDKDRTKKLGMAIHQAELPMLDPVSTRPNSCRSV